MGGLAPIAQSVIADTVPLSERPKFIGRLQACVGLGFVLGPLTMNLLKTLLGTDIKVPNAFAMSYI